MGRKKRNHSALQSNSQQGHKKQQQQPNLEHGEKFAVKKYRADKLSESMRQFVKYAKIHRMLDATYVRWNIGLTLDKPFCFSVRVGGTDLGWGRGSSRDAALDGACRATFVLFNAHGYKQFSLDEDSLLEMPAVPTYVPPPPPPPPDAPPPPPATLHDDTIPQPSVAAVPVVATAIGATHLATQRSVPPVTNGLLLVTPPASSATTTSSSMQSKQLKGGWILVYDPDASQPELCLEEHRARLYFLTNTKQTKLPSKNNNQQV